MTNQQRSRATRVVAGMGLATLALLGMLAVSSGTANAAVLQINSGTPYLCANVKGGAIANGTPIIGWACGGDFNMQWEYVNGQFLGLGTTAGVNKCLDIFGGGVSPGTVVDLYPCTGQPNQQWMILNGNQLGFPNSNLIYNPQSGTCLDSKGGLTKQLTIETCNGSTSQNWKVE